MSQMEKVMPLFEYEPLILSLELEILDEEEDIGDAYGAGPLGTIIAEELGNLRGGKDSPEREVIEQTLKQEEYVLQEVSYEEYASTTIEIGEQI